MDSAEREHLRVRAAAMRALMSSEGWDAYREALTIIETQCIQSLVTCDKDKHDYWAGFIGGLRQAFNLPQALIQQVKDLDRTGAA